MLAVLAGREVAAAAWAEKWPFLLDVGVSGGDLALGAGRAVADAPSAVLDRSERPGKGPASARLWWGVGGGSLSFSAEASEAPEAPLPPCWPHGRATWESGRERSGLLTEPPPSLAPDCEISSISPCSYLLTSAPREVLQVHALAPPGASRKPKQSGGEEVGDV